MAFVTAREYVLSPLTRVSSSRSRSSTTRFVRFTPTSVLQGRPESYLYLARACLRGGSASGFPIRLASFLWAGENSGGPLFLRAGPQSGEAGAGTAVSGAAVGSVGGDD